MKKLWLLFMAIFLLMSGASSAWAGVFAKKYVVQKGDCLWRISKNFEMTVKQIKKINKLKSDIIHPGDKLLVVLPDAKSLHAKPIKRKVLAIHPKHRKIVKSKGTSLGPSKVKLAGLRNYELKNAGRDKTTCTPETAAYLLGFVYKKEIKDTQLVFVKDSVDFGNQTIKKGERIKMTSGSNKVGEYITGFEIFTAKAAIYVKGKFRGYMYLRPECGNWIRHQEKKTIPVPVEAVKTESSEKLVEKKKPLSIFKSKKKERDLYHHELDAGVGIWKNLNGFSKGGWWFLQYKLYLDRLAKRLANGDILTPAIGVYARGDLGRTKDRYGWNHYGLGPEFGFILSGYAAADYPEDIQMMFRVLWEHLHGANHTTGYSKKEDRLLLGLYAEYLRRFAPDLMSILYFEGWADVGGTMKSTWSGDSPTNRTSFAIGYELEKKLSRKWRVRFGAEVGWAKQDDQWAAAAKIELRYDETYMAGPNVNYILASAVRGAAGGWSVGSFLRAEFKKQVREEHSREESAGVTVSKHDILHYGKSSVSYKKVVTKADTKPDYALADYYASLN